MCIGLWSPEAPANSASVVAVDRRQRQRRQGVADLAGRRISRLFMVVCLGLQPLRCTVTPRSSATCSPRWLLTLDFGHQEVERAALLVVDVRDPGVEGQRVAGIGHAVVGERLLAVQHARQFDAGLFAPVAGRPRQVQRERETSAAPAVRGGRRRVRPPRRSRRDRSRRWPWQRSATAPPRRWRCASGKPCRGLSCRSCPCSAVG